MEEHKKRRRDSDGKLVNVGNFDSDGVNVNRNTPDNSNDNLGVCFSRSLSPPAFLKSGRVFYFRLFIQPPSIRPISSSVSSRDMYVFFSIARTSEQIRTNVCRTFNFKSASASTAGFLLSGFEFARNSNSSISSVAFSHFCPKVKRSFLGNIFVQEYKRM